MARCVHGVPLSEDHPCPKCTRAVRDNRAVICGDMKFGDMVHGIDERVWYICTLDPHDPSVRHLYERVSRYSARRDPDAPFPVMLGTLPPLSEGTGPVGTPERRERLRRGGGDYQPERPGDREPPPTGGPLPAGVEGHSVGSRSRGEGAGTGMASVAEVKAMVDAALIEVSEGQQALHAAAEKLTQAQHTLAAAAQGSGHDAIIGSIGALENAVRSTEDALASTLVSVEQAQAYEASL